MGGVDLRNFGTTATMAPVLKRATGRLSDGRAVILSIDANLASAQGADVTGVAKIYLSMSISSSRTAFVTPVALTPAVAPASSTRYAVASMAVGTDDSIWVAWQGVDNGLYCTKWTYAAGSFTFVATQTVVAADAGITNKYRCIDIDIAGTNNPLIHTYEARASTGSGAVTRTYIRLNDNTTWRKAHESFIIAVGQFILPNSEDCSVSWSLDGIVSNVGKFLTSSSKSTTIGDIGDEVREISFNVSTGTDNSGTVLGTWSQSFHQNQAAGTRRSWIYKLTSGASALWLWCGSIGNAVPQFWATKLTTGIHTPPTFTRQGVTPVVAVNQYFTIDPSFNARSAIATSYADNRLIWAFASKGKVAPRVFREVMFRYNAITDYEAAFVDSSPRPLDGNYYVYNGPIAVYGGANNRLTAGTQTYNFAGIYGTPGNTTVSSDHRVFRFMAEDTFNPPVPYAPSPSGIVAVNRPNFQVLVQPGTSYLNQYGKVELQLATDSAFTANVRTAIQPNSAFQYFGKIDELTNASKLVTVAGTLLSAPLFTGDWFWRARVVTDKGAVSAWSDADDGFFDVLHTPTATPINPPDNSTQVYTSPFVFSWRFSDPESTDTQSAYYLQVTRADTGVLVVDTGWVSSTASSSSQTISSTLKEIPLKWSVAVKDADGTAGAFSTPRALVLADAPVLAVTTPPAAGVTGNANPTFEVDATNWTSSGSTFVRDTTQFQTGVASGKLTPNGVAAAPFVESDHVNIEALEKIKVSAWYRTPTTWAGGVHLSVNWYTSAGVYISTVTAQSVASLTGATWTQLSGTVQAPANAGRVSLVASISGTPAAANTLFIDEARINRNSINTALPTVGWTFTSGGTRTQRAYRIKITRHSDNVEVADTLWQFSTATSHTFTSQVVDNDLSYTITVMVQDTAGLVQTQEVYIGVSWTVPAQPSPVTLTQDGFKVVVNWDQTDIDVNWAAWRIWRRYRKPALPEMDFDATATTWVLVAEVIELTASSYNDYLAPLNRAADYAVTQLVDRFGDLIDSNITSYQTITCIADRYFFVPSTPVGTIASFEASGVTGDAFTDEVEQETVHIIGRGRQVQVGDDLGYSGTLTIHLRNPNTARGDREFIEYLASAQSDNVYLRTPFGDVLLVQFGSTSFSRMAGIGAPSGSQIPDLGDLSVPYVQVIDDSIQVTR